jgi:hypothetical protein
VALVAAPTGAALRAALARRVGLPRPSSAAVRAGLLVIACVAVALAVVTAAHGQARLVFGSHVVFSNASIVRPLAVAAVCAGLSGGLAGVVAAAAVLAIALVVPLPLTGYLKNIKELTLQRHPLRSLSECLQEVDASRRAAQEQVRGTSGLSTGDEVYLHQYFYYFRHAGGWEERQPEDDETLARALFVRGEERPVVINGKHYAESLERHPAAGPLPRGVRIGGVVVLLPGPYAPCAAAVPEGMY